MIFHPISSEILKKPEITSKTKKLNNRTNALTLKTFKYADLPQMCPIPVTFIWDTKTIRILL